MNGKQKGAILTHKNLEAWKEAISLTTEIYKLTQNFPKEELYGITNQMRRSAVSVPSNIAEGCARQTTKETIQFLHIALGSVAEFETQIIISNNLNFNQNSDAMLGKIAHIRKLVVGLIKFNKTKNV